MANINLQEIHDYLIEIARKAGDMITSAHPTAGKAGWKKSCT
jgi:myo-inositol-1(or 4)-monophosphatase